MRTLVLAALAATLAGCSCPLQRQASLDACPDANGFCYGAMPSGPPIEAEPSSFRTPSARVKPTIADRKEKPSPAGVNDKTRLAAKTAKPAVIAAKAESPKPGQPAETPDPVLVKARTTIAAKLENPASAEFADMNRAVRKNTLGQPVDTICGHVKGKKASGEAGSDRPFLYLVKDDEAYVVVDGPAGSVAAGVYRNICN